MRKISTFTWLVHFSCQGSIICLATAIQYTKAPTAPSANSATTAAAPPTSSIPPAS